MSSLLQYNVNRILLNVFVIASIGYLGTVIGAALNPNERRTIYLPLPHQVPKYPDGVSFRFAMVHDVIHDRYPRHGKTYYRERNRRVLAAIAKTKDADGLPPADRLHLIDDLGVGLDVLGEHDEAVRWMRRKLQAEEKLGRQGEELYASYANLGTFLIHGNMAGAFKNDKQAEERLREGLAFLYKGIDVNPQAHFGREIWQAVAAEFMLRVKDDPAVLLKQDFIGNPLNMETNLARSLHIPWRKTPIGARVDRYLKNPKESQDSRNDLRSHIARIEVAIGKEAKLVPFDEPCLGIIGLWRLGGGANPAFLRWPSARSCCASTSGLSPGPRISAIREASRFSKDEAIRGQLIDYCRRRQQAFALADAKQLEAEFEAELRVGLAYQEAYQKYEEDQLAAGKNLDDPHFYDAFDTQNGPIATPIGKADFLEVQPKLTWPESGPIVFGAGIGAAFGALVVLLAVRWDRRKSRP